MGLYAGVSFLRSDWYGVAIEVGGGPMRLLPCYVESVAGAGILKRPPSEGIFAPLETIGELNRRDVLNLSENELVKDAFRELGDADYGACYHKFRYGLRQTVPNRIGISHPYALSTVVRRALPALVDSSEPIVARSRTTRDAPLPMLQTGAGTPGLCALETPLAVVIEQVANGQLKLRSGQIATVMIISPGVAGFELTTIQVTRTGQRLVLNATDFSQAADSADVSEEKWTLNGPGEIFFMGGIQASEIAGHFSKARNHCGMREVPETDAASGVARYAAFCSEGSLALSDGSVSELDCRLVVPYAIGLFGQSSIQGAGDTFWCPVLEAGDQFGEKSALIRLAEPPDGVILAECLSRTRRRQEWVVGTQDLRWYSEVDISGVRTNEVASHLEIMIQNSAGCLNYGWSDSFVQASLRS